MRKYLLRVLPALLLLAALTACRAPTAAPTETAVTEPTEQPTEAPTEAPAESSTEPLTEAPTEPEWVPEYNGALGSAGSLRGTTLLISIFADDAQTAWDEEADREEMLLTLNRMDTAAQWLTEQAAVYGSDASFLYDWTADPDLRYDAAFPGVLVREDGGMYEVQADYVRENIDTESLRQKYHADNVIYFFLFNTPYEHTPNPWSLGFSSSTDYDIEYVNLYIRFGDIFDAPPSTYAHEILHAFGAPDLYYESTVIPKEFVDYCCQTGCNDIMFTVNEGETISSEFTPLDAYYVGIGPRPAEADEWGLGPSEYDAN